MANPRDPEIEQELLDQLQAIGHRWPRRLKESYTHPGCGEFTADPRLCDPVFLIRELRRHPELWEPLEKGTTPEHVYEKRHTGKKHVPGRDREPGHYVLIALAWLMVGKPELEKWYDNNLSSRELWEAAGFDPDDIPAPSTFYERMAELEQFVEGINDTTTVGWKIAMQKSPYVGRNWKIDGQAYESHVRLEHDPNCPKCQQDGEGDKAIPRFIERMPIEVANELRQAENALPLDAEEPDENENGDETPIVEVDEEMTKLRAAADSAPALDLEDEALGELLEAEERKRGKRKQKPESEPSADGRKAVYIQEHRFLCRDRDAGFKIYQSGSTGKKIKQWTGGIALKVSDDALGITFRTIHIPADEVEHTHWGEMLLAGANLLGTLPENVMGDRGHATRKAKKLDTLCGIGTVTPFRRPNGSVKDRSDMRVDGEHDEYGIPYCRYCGSPGTIVGAKELGFRILKSGEPVLIYRCANWHTNECKRTQTKHCSDEWLFLGPLTREEALYFDLYQAGKPGEKNNSQDRRHYGLAGKNPDIRTKRLGIPWMDLRASLGALLDIFRVLLRQGWLTCKAKLKTPLKLNRFSAVKRTTGERALKSFRKRRRRLGLLLPRGAKAIKLGLAFTGEIPAGWVTVAERRAAKERERLRSKRRGRRAGPSKKRGSPAAPAA